MQSSQEKPSEVKTGCECVGLFCDKTKMYTNKQQQNHKVRIREEAAPERQCLCGGKQWCDPNKTYNPWQIHLHKERRRLATRRAHNRAKLKQQLEELDSEELQDADDSYLMRDEHDWHADSDTDFVANLPQDEIKQIPIENHNQQLPKEPAMILDETLDEEFLRRVANAAAKQRQQAASVQNAAAAAKGAPEVLVLPGVVDPFSSDDSSDEPEPIPAHDMYPQNEMPEDAW